MPTATALLVTALHNADPMNMDLKIAQEKLGRKYVLQIDKNAKLQKGKSVGWLTGSLSLAPASEAGGPTLCPHSTPECRKLCVATSGNAMIFKFIREARVKLTQLLMAEPEAFIRVLAHDLVRLADKAKAEGYKAVARLNTFSDLEWEKIAPCLFEVAASNDISLYDYTKIPGRVVPPNYILTLSHSETNKIGSDSKKLLPIIADGMNVAVPFDVTRGNPLPAKWHGVKVVDGDKTDLRHLDPNGVVVGLRSKSTKNGRGKGSVSGFILSVAA